MCLVLPLKVIVIVQLWMFSMLSYGQLLIKSPYKKKKEERSCETLQTEKLLQYDTTTESGYH